MTFLKQTANLKRLKRGNTAYENLTHVGYLTRVGYITYVGFLRLSKQFEVVGLYIAVLRQVLLRCSSVALLLHSSISSGHSSLLPS